VRAGDEALQRVVGMSGIRAVANAPSTSQENESAMKIKVKATRQSNG
jgi:hypothetical protein